MTKHKTRRTESDYSLTMDDFLESVPVPNRRVTADRQTEEAVVLSVPLRHRWYMNPPLSWMLPFSTHRRIGLDKLGTEVWKTCDGEKTTEQIIDTFSERHHLSFHEARLSIMSFLKDLTERGVIVMVGKGQDS